MQQSGLRPDQVTQVRGFADQRLRNLKDSADPANRRVSIIVQYIAADINAAGTLSEDEKDSGESKPSAGVKGGTGRTPDDWEDIAASVPIESLPSGLLQTPTYLPDLPTTVTP